MTSTFAKLAAAGVLSLCTAASALAGSVTQPGETVGLASGAPLPQGLYFVNTGDWGRRSDPADTSVGVDIPVIAWSTPWTILGGRVQFLFAGPVVEVGVHRTTYLRGVYNPLVSGQLAWDLGNNWGFSYLLGAYIDVNSEVAWSSTSLNQRFALSYTGYQLNLTANVIWGTQFDHVTGRSQLSPCPDLPPLIRGCNPDFLNVDLTATRKFGEFEFGLVAFGSTDLNSPIDGYAKQSQVAVGGLIGKSFGGAILQAYLTHDVYEKNYGGHDTRLWGRVILPLWTAPAAPVATPLLYRKG
jgi:Putative MetA-pathway of phenol degradation